MSNLPRGFYRLPTKTQAKLARVIVMLAEEGYTGEIVFQCVRGSVNKATARHDLQEDALNGLANDVS